MDSTLIPELKQCRSEVTGSFMVECQIDYHNNQTHTATVCRHGAMQTTGVPWLIDHLTDQYQSFDWLTDQSAISQSILLSQVAITCMSVKFVLIISMKNYY